MGQELEKIDYAIMHHGQRNAFCVITKNKKNAEFIFMIKYSLRGKTYRRLIRLAGWGGFITSTILVLLSSAEYPALSVLCGLLILAVEVFVIPDGTIPLRSQEEAFKRVIAEKELMERGEILANMEN